MDITGLLLPALFVGPGGAVRLVRRFAEVTVAPALVKTEKNPLEGQLHDLALARN